MRKLQDMFQISNEATRDLRKGIIACTITNIIQLLSVAVVVLVFLEILHPLEGYEISWSYL